MRIFINKTEIPFSDIELFATFKNPVFNEHDGSYIYNFTLPESDNLNTAISHKNRINQYGNIEADFILEDGLFVLSGIALIQRCINNNKSIGKVDIQVGLEKGVFNYITKNLKLNELPWGKLNFYEQNGNNHLTVYDVIDLLANNSVLKWPETNWTCYPVHNESFFYDTIYDTQFSTKIKYTNFILNNTGPYFSENGFDFICSPSLFFGFVIQEIFKMYGYTIDLSFFERYPELKELVIDSNYYSGIWLQKLSGGVPDFKYQWDELFDYKLMIPSLTVKEFFEALKFGFGIVFDINDKTKHVSIIQINDYINNPKKVKLNIYDLEIEKKQIDKSSGYIFKYDHNSNDSFLTDDYKDVTDSKLTIIDPVNNISLLPQYPNPGSVCLVLDEDKWYVYFYNTGWNFFSPNILFEVSLDLKNIEFKPKFAPLYSFYEYIVRGDVSSNFTWRVPFKKEKCNSNILIDNSGYRNINEFSLRFVFYRGISDFFYNPFNNVIYPYATHDNTYNNQIAIPNKKYRLTFENGYWDLSSQGAESYGIIHNFFSSFLNWSLLVKQPFTLSGLIKKEDIHKIHSTAIVMINGHSFLIDQYKLRIRSSNTNYFEIEADVFKY